MAHLIAEKVCVRYGSRAKSAGLHDISIAFRPGVTALVGPNGCGKSTLLRVLATVLTPASGSLRYGDLDILRTPGRLRAILGYVPQHFGVYQHLTASEFVAYVGALRGLSPRSTQERARGLLDQLGLAEVNDRRLFGFSSGMLRRVGIAAALIGDPDVLLLDEATAGLDSAERSNLMRLLRERRDRIVVMSTHLFDELDGTADFVVCMRDGAIVETRARRAESERGELEAFCREFLGLGER